MAVICCTLLSVLVLSQPDSILFHSTPLLLNPTLPLEGNDDRYVTNVQDVRYSVFESLIRSLGSRRLELHRKFPKAESLKVRALSDPSLPHSTQSLSSDSCSNRSPSSYSTTLCNATLQYNTIQYNTIQYNTIQ